MKFRNCGSSALAGSLLLVVAACGGTAAPTVPSSTPPMATASPGGPSSAPAGAIPTIPPGSAVKITTATGVPSGVFTPVWIAVDNGIFAKYGLDATLVNIEGVKQAQAIIAGDIQIGNVGGAEILNSRAGGASLVGIRESTASPVFELHAAPAIKQITDLRGKTVAVTQTGSSTDMSARVLLKNHGLEPDQDVKLLNSSDMPAILAALASRQVQGGVMSPPTTIKADNAGFPKLASTVDEHVALQQNLTVAMKPYADAHPDVVYAYLKAQLEATAMFFNQPDLAVAAIAKHTQSDQATAKAAYDAFLPAMEVEGLVQEQGFKTVQDFGANPKARGVTLAGAHDDHFLQQLQASGFIDQLHVKQ